MTIKEVYLKYKHLDCIICNGKVLDDSGFCHTIIRELWEVIKQEVKG